MSGNYKLIYNDFFRYVLSIIELLACRRKPGYKECNEEDPEEIYFREPVRHKL